MDEHYLELIRRFNERVAKQKERRPVRGQGLALAWWLRRSKHPKQRVRKVW